MSLMVKQSNNYAALEKYVYWLLLIVMAIIPLQQEVTAIMILIVTCFGLLVAFLRRKESHAPILSRWLQITLWVLLILSYISIHASGDRALSTYNFIYVVGQYTAIVWLLLRYGVGASEELKEDLKLADWRQWPRPLQIVSTVLGMSFFVAGYGIVQHFIGVIPTEAWVDPNEFPELRTRVISTLVNPNILGGYLVLMISMMLGLFSTLKNKNLKTLLFIGVLLGGLCLVYTYSRGNWLALLVAVFIFCIFFYRKLVIPLLLGGFLVMWFLEGGAVSHRIMSIFGSEDTSVALRFAYLESTLFIIEENLWGVGWYGYQFVYPAYDFYLNNPNVIMYHCHNLFLNITAELGLQGIFVFVVIWLTVFLKAIKLARFGKRKWLKGIGRGYFIASIGIAVGGLTDHVYFNVQMGLLFWSLAILILICSEVNKKTMNIFSLN